MVRDVGQGDRTTGSVCPECGEIFPGGWIGKLAYTVHYERTHMSVKERVDSGRGDMFEDLYVALKYPKRTKRILRENLAPLARWLKRWWNQE
jgi:hypothetical protein